MCSGRRAGSSRSSGGAGQTPRDAPPGSFAVITEMLSIASAHASASGRSRRSCRVIMAATGRARVWNVLTRKGHSIDGVRIEELVALADDTFPEDLRPALEARIVTSP